MLTLALALPFELGNANHGNVAGDASVNGAVHTGEFDSALLPLSLLPSFAFVRFFVILLAARSLRLKMR